MFWKVRAMPSCVIVCGLRPVMSVPWNDDLAAGRLVQPGDHVEERRLARAVRPDQADDRALLDREVDPVDRHQAAEALGQAAYVEQVGHASVAQARTPPSGRSMSASSPS